MSPSGRSSPGAIPAIFTYPPSGMADTAHSVSPRLRDHTTGPKPMLKRSTRMPDQRAAR